MGDLLKSGAAWLAAQLGASASEAVAYARPGTALTTTWQATYGSQLLRVSDGKGPVVRTLRTDRDFVGPVATLQAAGLWPPLRGDQVTMPGGEAFEVDSYGSEAHWRYADPFETLVRVHTKAQGL
jgi:hypothetical protein